MRVRLITWLLVFCCPVFVWANVGNERNGIAGQQVNDEISPIDSLIFTVDLEDEDGIYISPQSVMFTVQADRLTDKTPLKLICIVTTDAFLPVDSLFFVVQPDSIGKIRQKISFLPPVAGFYRITVYAENGRTKSLSRKFTIGYNPEQIVALPGAKADFTAFWKKTKAELKRVTSL